VWMCRYPILLAAPHEAFRLHFAPSTHHFLNRGSSLSASPRLRVKTSPIPLVTTPPEQRALAFAAGPNPLVLHMGTEDDPLLGEGWWMAEGRGRDAARWAIGTRASVILPQAAPRDRTITIEMQPLTHATLPAQTVRVLLNGKPVGERDVDDASGRYSFAAAAATWREGANALELLFGRSNVPAQLTGSTDQRSLSALVQTIRVDDDGSQALETDAPPARTVRLDSTLSQLPAGHILKEPLGVSLFDRGALARLLGRIGFDPVTTIPRMESGSITLEELAMSLVWSSACEDDMTFVRRAYAVLLQQVPNAGEEASLKTMLRTRSRVQVIQHLLQKNEFLSKVTTPASPVQSTRQGAAK
jgi:hypothetical protein